MTKTRARSTERRLVCVERAEEELGAAPREMNPSGREDDTMAGNEGRHGFTRRDFLRNVALGGAAATALAATEGHAAQETGAAQAATTPRRQLGKTGVEVSTLALGGMFDTVNNQLLLKQAYNWGVTMWDTAEAYGNGLSEEGYGRFISRNPDARKNLFVITKYRNSAPEKMTEAVDAALKRLKTDYVDLFFPHGISNFSDITGLKAWADAARKSGKIKFFGFSSHSNMEDCLLAAAKSGWIDAVLFSYNFRIMHTPKMKEAVAACTSAGVGLIAMKSQGGGPVKTDSQAELDMAGKFLARGFSDKQAKLKAILDNPAIASTCVQMPTLTILSSNVAAARDKTALSMDERDSLERFACETRSDYCAGCGNICSAAVGGLVPVNDVLRCLMYYRDYGERDLAREVFAALPESTGKHLREIDFARAERACPQGIAIAKLMREATDLFA